MKMKRVVIGILAVLMVIIMGVIGILCVNYFGGKKTSGSQSQYALHMESASKFYESGDYKSAIAEYRLAIENEPDLEEPYYMISMIYI